MYTYADDTTLIITAATETGLQTLAQSELHNLITYFHNNNLVPNPTKTQYTIYCPTRPTDNITLQINNTAITRTSKAKLLGITVQSNLKHHQTITNIIKKLQQVIHKITYANKFLSTRDMKERYYSLAYSHILRVCTEMHNNKPLRAQPQLHKHYTGT